MKRDRDRALEKKLKDLQRRYPANIYEIVKRGKKDENITIIRYGRRPHKIKSMEVEEIK